MRVGDRGFCLAFEVLKIRVLCFMFFVCLVVWMRGKWFQIQNVKPVIVMYRFVYTMKQERGEIHESRDLVTLLLNDGNVCLFGWV